MKKLNLFLGLAAISMVLFFNSCSSDEDAQGPGLELISDAEVTTAANSSITIQWKAYAGDANLEFFTITEGNSPITGWDEFEIPTSQNENFPSTATVQIGEANTTFTLTVTDKDGLKESKTVTVTVEAGLAAKGSKTLGAGGNKTLGSYYSVSANTVYLTADLTAVIASKVDFVFDADASTATFKSPIASANDFVKKSGRVTKYKKATFAFATATESDLNAVTPTAESITVSANDVVVFVNNDNVKGVFEVSALTVAANGSVTIDIKVKQ